MEAIDRMSKLIPGAIIMLAARIALLLRQKLDRMLSLAILDKVANRGVNCRMEGYGTLIDEGNLVLGDHVSIGRDFFIRAAGGVHIGSHTHISRNVNIHTVNHNVGGKLLPYDRDDIIKPVTIGRYVWIGMNCNILPGVHIGDGAIIGMGTTISKDVEAGSIVVGAPSRVVGERDKEKVARLVAGSHFLPNGATRLDRKR